jgi:hypothetical protein
VLNARSGTHHLHVSGVRLADVALVIAMRDNTLADVADNLDIGVVMQTKPRVRRDLTVIEHNEIADWLMRWVAVRPYCEVVFRFEPSGVSSSDFIECLES